MDTSDHTLLANGICIVEQGGSLKYPQDSKPKSNMRELPQIENRVIVDVCASFLEEILDAVCEI
eukprot:gene19819-21758_t